MKINQFYGVLFIVALIIVLVYLRKAKKENSIVAKKLVIGFLWSCIAITSYIIILFSNSYIVNSFFYSVFFLSMDWLLYSVLRFVGEYTSIKYKNTLSRTIINISLILDSISMMLNVIFEHAISYQETYYDGILFLIFNAKPLYNIHLIFCYIIFAFIVVCLTQKVIISPSLYKRRYFTPLIELIVIVGMNGLILIFQSKVDISILFYALAAIALYNTVFTYQPRHLLDRTMNTAMKHLDDSFVLFDLYGQCIWQNNQSINLFGKIYLLDKFREIIQNNEVQQKNGTKKNQISLVSNEIRKHFDYQYHEMKDSKKRYMGCFYIFHDVTLEDEYLRRQEYMAHYDQFTGLYNKYFFCRKVSEVLSNGLDTDYIIMVSNVGRFKVINDTFGQRVGDQVLRRIAQQIIKTVPKDAIYGRLESDKFAIFMKKEDFNEKIYFDSCDTIFNLSDVTLPIKQYLGIYQIEDLKTPVDIMCDRAMLALNTIKGSYQQTVAYYDESIYNEINHEQEVIGEFKNAINNGEFVIYLQPQLNHKTKNVVGAEALVRWIHPIRGMIPPDDFIPVLEKNGLIAQLDQYVWNKVCIILKKWINMGYVNQSISINISPKDLYLIDIYSVLLQMVKQHDIPTDLIKLEITETSLITDVERHNQLIQKLQAIGFVIEMDDFGSGYSSLNTLKDIPVDVIKMDMKFFQQTKNVSRSINILMSVVELAKRLNVPVIAEGVEHEEQADFLSSIGCKYIQGYLYSKPLPVKEFEEFLNQHPYTESIK